MTFSKRNEKLHAALDWEVMFLTEFSTNGRTDGRRRRTDDDDGRRRTDDGLNDGRTTTDDDDDDDDGRRRMVSVFQLFTPQKLVVQKRYFFFRNPLDEIYLPRWFPSL